MRLGRNLIRVLGPLLFLLILSRMDLGRVAETMAAVRVNFLLAALVLYPGLVLLKAWRWHILLRQQHINYGLVTAFLAYNSSLSAGYVTPGRLGEFVKALYLRQDEDVLLGQALSSVLMDRLFDLYVLLMTASLGIAIFSLPEQLSIVAPALLVAGGLAPLLVLIPGATRRLIVLLNRLLPILGAARHREEIKRTLNGFERGMEQLLTIRLLLPLLVTVVAYAVFYLQCYLTAVALRLPLSYPYAAFCVSIASLLALLPISISGLGVRGATFIALLLPLGIVAEMAVSYSLLILFVFNIFGGGWGAIAWFIKPLK
ncbi:MAG: hypothetical protein CEE40_02390 [Chloroflexi bacterium B3_Chlor]|nr:MAG: hypothetical protein CEE40_02390 [Chloroflexi bacterium B3_Chlor]